MAGFGSIVDQPAAVFSGQDDSICMGERRSESHSPHQALTILDGSPSLGLERTGGGDVDNRSVARKLYDAASGVETSAVCADRRGYTYQLGCNEAQSEVTGREQTSWQDWAEAAKTANFDRNEIEHQHQQTDVDNYYEGRKNVIFLENEIF